MLLASYRAVLETGALSTDIGWRSYASIYRHYKWAFDRDLEAIRQFICPGSVVIDIGANVGSSTLALAQWVGQDGRVLAIEPEKRNASELRRAVTLYGYDERVSVIEAAAWDSRGIVKIGLSKYNPTDHRVGSQGAPVQAITVDSVVEEGGWPTVAAIKIDVQGAEVFVVKGAHRVLRKHRPVVFTEVFEEGLRQYGHSTSELVELLWLAGYFPHLVDRGAIKPAALLDIVRRCAKNGYTDAIFLPRP